MLNERAVKKGQYKVKQLQLVIYTHSQLYVMSAPCCSTL